MRTIKFRGKTFDNGEWVYGSLIQRIGHLPTIVEEFASNGKLVYRQVAVTKDSVGQFTGLHDKNGREIYEGDVVKMSTKEYGDELYRIGFENSHIGAFCLCTEDENSRFVSIFGRDYGYEPFYCEVIGNIHENKNLMEGGEK